MKLSQKICQTIQAPIGSGGRRRYQLDAVAGRDYQAFVYNLLIDEPRQRIGEQRLTERQSLTHLERRRLMTQSYEYYVQNA